MKVYVVHYNNGEPKPNDYHCIEDIFSTREDAERYLDKDYQRYNSNVFNPKLNKIIKDIAWKKQAKSNNCSMGYSTCNNCEKYLNWLNNDFDAKDFCDEYNHSGNIDNHPFARWEILEWNVV